MVFKLYKLYQITQNDTSGFAISAFKNSWQQLFWKLKIDGNLVVKSKVPSRSGSASLRQLNPIYEKGP